MEFNRKRGLFTVFAIVLIYGAYVFIKIPTKNLKYYSEIYSITKKYTIKNTIDTFKVGDSLVLISNIKSDLYSFTYEMNTQEFDSIFYFGEYPSLSMVEYHRPDLYFSYKKYHSTLFENLNCYGVFGDKHFYDVYALYKDGDITFCKISSQTNHITMDPYYTMFRKNQKFNVRGINYSNKNDIISSIHFYPVDSMFKNVEKVTVEQVEKE